MKNYISGAKPRVGKDGGVINQVTDHAKVAALELAFPAVVAAAKALVGEDGRENLEYVRGIVETICDTFRVPDIDNDDSDGKRAEVYFLITGVSETPWGIAGKKVTIVGARHYNVRMHEGVVADVPVSMLTDERYFDADGNPTHHFDQWMCDNGDLGTPEIDLLDNDELAYEYEQQD